MSHGTARQSGWLAVGTVLAGKYRIDKILGEGGMGVVAAATHIQLDEPVAVKCLHPHMVQQEDIVARFQREAKAARKIKSEHVVRILDVGELDNGSPYMVMEYLAGTDLDAHLRSLGPLQITDAVDFVLQACEALAEAHIQGMVHRDLKPANLFVSKRADQTPLVKVLDFGISKVTGEGGTDLGMTKTNSAVLGSPLYMAPEQMRSMRDVDARTDIWALGAIIHELLIGAPPFQATTLTELCASILQDPPAPVRTIRADVPAGLEATILHCLAKDPAFRYPDVAALAMDLHPFASPAGRASAERIYGVYRAHGVPRASKPPSAVESARTMGVEIQDPTGPKLPAFVVTPRHDTQRIGHATTGKVWESGSIPAPTFSQPPPKTSGGAVVMGLVALVAVLGTIVVIFVVLPRFKPQPPATAMVVSTGVAPTASVIPSSAPAPATASAAPSAVADTSAPKPAPVAKPQPRPTPRPATKGDGCDPPYVFTAKGEKKWKPECVN